jgi:hypothetical protein
VLKPKGLTQLLRLFFFLTRRVRLWGLSESIRQDVKLLTGLLVIFSHETTNLSHANTLHCNPLPDHLHPEKQVDDGLADYDPARSTGTLQHVHTSPPPALRMSTPPRDIRMGVIDPRPDNRLSFVGYSHQLPPGFSRLSQSQSMPTGTPYTQLVLQAPTANP